MEIQKKLHFGVYGLLKRKEEILVVRKSKGPYKGLFDLPGGSPFHGESITETLFREIKEETGIIIKKCSFLNDFSFLTSYKKSDNILVNLHHVALLYHVHRMDISNFNSSINAEDVMGCFWMDKKTINKNDCSPLLSEII